MVSRGRPEISVRSRMRTGRSCGCESGTRPCALSVFDGRLPGGTRWAAFRCESIPKRIIASMSLSNRREARTTWSTMKRFIVKATRLKARQYAGGMLALSAGGSPGNPGAPKSGSGVAVGWGSGLTMGDGGVRQADEDCAAPADRRDPPL
jgi:hypothetical protein